MSPPDAAEGEGAEVFFDPVEQRVTAIDDSGGGGGAAASIGGGGACPACWSPWRLQRHGGQQQ